VILGNWDGEGGNKKYNLLQKYRIPKTKTLVFFFKLKDGYFNMPHYIGEVFWEHAVNRSAGRAWELHAVRINSLCVLSGSQINYQETPLRSQQMP
jgi:hypothetical protein